ncbi:MAG: hypothetical protein J6Q37_06115, partial [Bacteroidales bacterium]|nr:hypothetical protein [Bacteroidales bacterium]
IKPCVPVVVGESDPEIDSVFERKVLYTNLPEPKFMGSRTEIMSLLTFADKVAPTMWDKHEEILSRMDLQGACQRHNLRTVLAALEVLDIPFDRACVAEAIERTAARTDFHGRWERLSSAPLVICDIGHNEHGLRLNMKKLSDMLVAGECGSLVIVYGIMSDKDFHSIAHLLPSEAHYVFTSAPGPRALPAEALAQKYEAYCAEEGIPCASYQVEQEPSKAMKMALETAADMNEPLIYVGGSTYVVAEIIRWFKEK